MLRLTSDAGVLCVLVLEVFKSSAVFEATSSMSPESAFFPSDPDPKNSALFALG